MDPVVFNCPMCGSIEFNFVVQESGKSLLICTKCDADVMLMEFGDEEIYEYALDSVKEGKKHG